MYHNENQQVLFSIGADSYSASTAVAGTDISNIVGNLVVFASAGVGTAGTLAFTVQHNDVATGNDADWANVPAAALVSATGEADTFDAITDTASNQSLHLVRERLKRYVRVTATIGSSGVYEICAGFVGLKRYS